MRSPFGHNQEGKTRKQSNEEPDDLKDSLDRAYVMFERFEANKDAINKLFSLKYRALMYFGENVEDSIRVIEEIINKLFNSAHLLGRIYWPKLGKCRNQEELNNLIVKIDEQEKIFWLAGKDDKISIDIKNAIEKAEKELKKWIR